jgi:hypothetical protein
MKREGGFGKWIEALIRLRVGEREEQEMGVVCKEAI